MIRRAIKNNVPTPYYPAQEDVRSREEDIAVVMSRFWKWVANNQFGNHNTDGSDVSSSRDYQVSEQIIREFFDGDASGLEIEEVDAIRSILHVSKHISKILLNSN